MTAPTTVVEALAAIMSELPAIAKDQKSTQGYKYRGIEQITRALQPLLAKYGVVYVPHVRSCEMVSLTINGNPWTDTRLEVAFTIHGPGGSIEAGPVWGIGRDNSDKGANKAMTQAYKYVLMQTLCISDASDDVDAGSPPTEAHGPAPIHTATIPPPSRPPGGGWLASVMAKCRALDLDEAAIGALLTYAGLACRGLAEVPHDARPKVVETIRRLDAHELDLVSFAGPDGTISYSLEEVAPA